MPTKPLTFSQRLRRDTTRNKPSRVDNRPSSASRGYGYNWQRFRKMRLARDPLCQDCLPRAEAASQVHHKIKKADGGHDSIENTRCLCAPCHSRRSGRGE